MGKLKQRSPFFSTFYSWTKQSGKSPNANTLKPSWQWTAGMDWLGSYKRGKGRGVHFYRPNLPSTKYYIALVTDECPVVDYGNRAQGSLLRPSLTRLFTPDFTDWPEADTVRKLDIPMWNGEGRSPQEDDEDRTIYELALFLAFNSRATTPFIEHVLQQAKREYYNLTGGIYGE